MEWISLLIYIGGAALTALAIRAMTPRERLDRGAALAACVIWPTVWITGLLAVVGFGWMALFFPDTADNEV